MKIPLVNNFIWDKQVRVPVYRHSNLFNKDVYTLNVLFQIRDDYKSNLAGDSIQMLKTKQHIGNMGVNVDVSSSYNISLEKYDVLHIFNVIRAEESYKFVQNSLKQNKPYVLSTIYWNMKEYINKDVYTSSTIEWWSKLNNMRKYIILNASALLPNSEIEMQVLRKDFSANNKYFVIPNCSDWNFYSSSPDSFVSKYGLKDFILCVGRISYRKNQLALIKALKDTDYILVFIGRKSNKKYFQKCKDAANQNVFFISEIKHSELASAYAAAKVHVLPSWFETPGLASLEAGLAGCNIVTTCKGSTKEYFKQYAYYCDPSDIESIKKAVECAYKAPKTDELKECILNNYMWESAALKTLEAYRYVLNTKK